MPLASVAPGDYVAHAILSAAGEVVAERTRHVEVLAGDAPAPPPGAAAPVVSPVVIARGDLGQRYLKSLAERAQGTPFADASKRAVEGRWEEADRALRRADAADGSPGGACAAHRVRARGLRGSRGRAGQSLDVLPVTLTASCSAGRRTAPATRKRRSRRGAAPRTSIRRWSRRTSPSPMATSSIPERALALQALRAGLTACPARLNSSPGSEQLDRIR